MSLIEDTLVIFIEYRFVIGPRNNLSERRFDNHIVAFSQCILSSLSARVCFKSIYPHPLFLSCRVRVYLRRTKMPFRDQWRDVECLHHHGIPIDTTSNETAKLFDAVLTQYTGW